MERITFVTEPLLTPEFVQYRVVVPLLARLKQRYDVALAAPALSDEVLRGLEAEGIRAITPQIWFPEPRQPRDEVVSYVASWLRDALLGLNRRALDRLLDAEPGLRVNYSMTTACHADLWYVLGRPIGPTLRTIQKSLAWRLRLPVSILGPMAGVVDRRHMDDLVRNSGWVVASNQFLAGQLAHEGYSVRGILNIFLPSDRFRPTTAAPTRDYVLLYLGKETDTATAQALIETGVPIKVFGAKSAGWVAGALKGTSHPNVEMVGFVDDERLAELYSNAAFTAFPFTEEPFGLVPVESMACGTPVLTYNRQGPAETVVDGVTGWLVEDSAGFLRKAKDVLTQGYGAWMSRQCVSRVQRYQVGAIAEGWDELIRERLAASSASRIPRLARYPSRLWGPSPSGSRSEIASVIDTRGPALQRGGGFFVGLKDWQAIEPQSPGASSPWPSGLPHPGDRGLTSPGDHGTRTDPSNRSRSPTGGTSAGSGGKADTP